MKNKAASFGWALVFGIVGFGMAFFSPQSLPAQSDQVEGANNFYNQAIEYFNNQQYEAAIPRFEQALPLYLQANYQARAALCQHHIGICHYRLGDRDAGHYTQAIGRQQQALAILPAEEVQIQAECYRYQGWAYYQADQYKPAIFAFSEAIRANRKISANGNLADCYWGTGMCHFSLDEYPEMFDALTRARTLFEAVNSPVPAAKCRFFIGFGHYLQDNYQACIDSLQSLPEFFLAHALPDQAAKVYKYLALSWFELENYPQANLFYEKALPFFRDSDDASSLAVCYVGLGNCAVNREADSPAIGYFTSAIDLYRQLENRERLAATLEGRAKCYFRSGQDNPALKDFAEAADLYAGLGDLAKEASPRYFIGKIHFRQEHYDSAIPILQRARDLYHESVDTEGFADCNALLGDCFNRKQAFQEAKNYYQIAWQNYQNLQMFPNAMNCLEGIADCDYQLDLNPEAGAKYQQLAEYYAEQADFAESAGHYYYAGRAWYFCGDRYADALNCFQQALQKYQSVNQDSMVAKTYHQIGNTFREMKLPDAALKHYLNAIQFYQATAQPQGIAECTFARGKIFWDLNQIYEAEEAMARALPLYRKTGDAEGQADCLLNLSSLSIEKDEFPKAYQLALEAHQLYQGLDLPQKLGTCRLVLGKINRWLEKYEQALPWFYQCKQIFLAQNAPDRVAYCLLSLSETYLEMPVTYFDRAWACCDSALTIFRQLKDPEGEAGALLQLGNIYMKKTNYTDARVKYEQALALQSQFNDPVKQAECYKALGDVNYNRGAFADARINYERALEIYNELNDIRKVIRIRFQIAQLLSQEAKYDQAISEYLKLLNIADRGQLTYQSFICRNELGNIYSEVNLPDSARWYLEQSIPLAIQLQDSSLLATALVNLGKIEFEMEEFQPAGLHFRQSRELFQKLNDTGSLAICDINLGNVESHFSQTQVAIQKYQQALNLARQVNFPRAEAIALNNLASIDMNQGNFRSALDQLNQAEARLKTSFIKKTLPLIYGNQGQVLEKLQQYEAAFQAYKQAIQIIEEIRLDLKRESLARSFLSDKAAIYERMITLLITQLNRPEDAFIYSVYADLDGLDELIEYKIRSSGNEILIKKFEEYQENQHKIIQNETERERELGLPPSRQNPFKIERLEADRKQLNTSKQQFLELAETQGIGNQAVQLVKIQQNLADSVSILMYHCTPDQLFIFRLSRHEFQVKMVPITKDSIDFYVKNYRDYIRQEIEAKRGHRGFTRVTAGPAAGNEIRLKQSLTRLYDLLIRPVEPGVENSAQLCIIPDGNLFYLPFHGLIRRSDGGRQQYTLEKWAISYLTSAEFIDITRAPQTNTSQRVVAFADADGTLPNSAQEVRAIRAFRPDAVIYTGKEATETRAIQEAANSSVLIFSNHCLLNSQNPNQTFIQLYPSATADGRLHLPEVQNLRCSRLNLAVLTACQTAMGEQAPGREVHNMARSFSIAGASAIIASLWSISDLATYDLMVIFYEQLLSKKQSKIEALRRAQLTMLQRQEYRHPFYWAAFELIGDWR